MKHFPELRIDTLQARVTGLAVLSLGSLDIWMALAGKP